MKKSLLLFVVSVLSQFSALSQILNTGFIDTNEVEAPGKLSFGGYVETYYGYDFGRNPTNERLYGVSYHRTDEININLAYIDVKYNSKTIRARFVPGFGSYMAANYVTEPNYLQNIIEASVGFRLAEKGNIWVDAGLIGSPFTNESPKSMDHLLLTRSLSAEYVPYYLSGVRLSSAISNELHIYGYLVNGWQDIQETNTQKSVCTQVEFRPTDKILINWNTYWGDEASSLTPKDRDRLFTDIYLIYNPSSNLSLTACAYFGKQQRKDSVNAQWWSANICARYTLNEKLSLAGRYENFSDPNGGVSHNLMDLRGVGLKTQSATFNLTYKLLNHIMLRTEYRHFFGDEKAFRARNNAATSTNSWWVTGASISF